VDSVSHIRSINGSAEPDKELPDGWRLLQEMNQVIRDRYPWKISIAEDLMCNDWVTKHREDGGAGFDSQWDCQFVHPIRRVLTEAEDKNRNMEEVAHAVSFHYGDDAFNRIIYTESHDEVAEGGLPVSGEIDPNGGDSWFAIKRSMLGVMLAALSPGIPMIFQGQEFCFDREFQDNSPIDWSRAERFQGIIRMVADAFKLRRNFHNTSLGLSGQKVEITHMDEERNVLAFHRLDGDGGPGNSVMVIANFDSEPLMGYNVEFPLPGHWDTLLNTDSQDYHEAFNNIGVPGLEAHVPEDQPDAKPTSLVDVGGYSLLVLGYLG
jgi:1,4-alpha-glucan branching enzyme